MIRTVEDLAGPAGRLEALLNEGKESAAYSALVCHPHPPSGGTMHTKVVYQTMKAFAHFDLPVLRFNFRGAGLSEGAYDDGIGEVEDVRAALDWLDLQFRLPILLAGFSFGANMAWRAGCGDARVAGLIGLGMPLLAGGRHYSYEFLPKCTQPKLLLTGAEDPFAPRDRMENIFRDVPGATTVEWVDGAEHFFQGTPNSPGPKLETMQNAVRSWLQTNYFAERHAET